MEIEKNHQVEKNHPIERRNALSVLWGALAEKGKWTTLLSMVMAFPINGAAIYYYFSNPDWFTEQRLLALAILNGIAFFWAIMPSRITAKAANFELIVED